MRWAPVGAGRTQDRFPLPRGLRAEAAGTSGPQPSGTGDPGRGEKMATRDLFDVVGNGTLVVLRLTLPFVHN